MTRGELLRLCRQDRGLTLQEVAKACPGFSVKQWLDRGMQPLPKHIIPE